MTTTDELSDIPDFLDRRPAAKAKAKTTPSWRDVLPIHPAANLLPLMTPDELRATAEDIKKNGLRVPVVLWAAGPNEKRMGEKRTDATFQLLDGRNRLDAAEAVGLTVKISPNFIVTIEGVPFHDETTRKVFEFKTAYDAFNGMKPVQERWIDPYEFVLSANIHRRHLTTAQRIELVEKVLKANPRMSGRRVAKLAGVSPTTAAKARDKLEKSGDVSTVDTSIDTKGRKQPTKKKRRTADDFVADMKARKAAEAEQDIEHAELSMSAQEKLDAAIQQHKKKLALEFEQRVHGEVSRRIDEMLLPFWKERIEVAKTLYGHRKALMDKATFNKIRRGLHPDSRNSISDKMLAEAFDAFMALEKFVLNEKDSPTTFPDLPSSLAEWDKMRAKKQR